MTAAVIIAGGLSIIGITWVLVAVRRLDRIEAERDAWAVIDDAERQVRMAHIRMQNQGES